MLAELVAVIGGDDNCAIIQNVVLFENTEEMLRVFIDLDDMKKCYQTNTLARLLYVGVSRARHQVFLTGDLV